MQETTLARAKASHPRGLRRFLHTENPFYLISCGLIIYGIQLAALQEGDLLHRSLLMSGWTAFYAVLMSVVVVGIVRLAGVWQDARTVFLIIPLALIASSTGYDEWALQSRAGACLMATIGMGLSVLLGEFVLRACRLRLPMTYRVTYYAMLGVFFAAAPVFAESVRQRQQDLSGWSGLIFSSAIAVTLLGLVPGIRRRNLGLRHHGSPWRFPLYPLSLFFVLVVVAIIRAHAVWMAFAFKGGPIQFEAMLIWPLAVSALVLLSSWDLYRKKDREKPATYLAMLLTPLLVVLAIPSAGETAMPLGQSLPWIFGSARTMTMVSVVMLYGFWWINGIQGARHALAIGVFAIPFWGDLPQVFAAWGVQRWMCIASASLLAIVLYWRNLTAELRESLLAVAASGLLGWCLRHRHVDPAFNVFVSLSVLTMAWMLVGGRHKTYWAAWLRRLSAALTVVLCVAIATMGYRGELPTLPSAAILLGVAATLMAYRRWVRRRSWLQIATVPLLLSLILVGRLATDRGYDKRINWPVSMGAISMVAGMGVTLSKVERVRARCVSRKRKTRYRKGL
ncbi:MAG: hypothetical protein AAF958_08535 [Planctomycetota bacterium]